MPNKQQEGSGPYAPLGSLTIEEAEDRAASLPYDHIKGAVERYKIIDRRMRRGTMTMRATLSAFIDLLVDKGLVEMEEVVRAQYKWMHLTTLFEEEARAEEEARKERTNGYDTNEGTAYNGTRRDGGEDWDGRPDLRFPD